MTKDPNNLVTNDMKYNKALRALRDIANVDNIWCDPVELSREVLADIDAASTDTILEGEIAIACPNCGQKMSVTTVTRVRILLDARLSEPKGMP